MSERPGPAPILLVSDTRDWHARELARALERLGERVVHAPLARLAFDSGAPAGIAIPGVAGGLPRAVVVRQMPGGTFQQVTLLLGLLHALEGAGVPVFNSARAIERCVDKSTTTNRLQRAGIATPRTWAGIRDADARACAAAAAREGRTLVQKPLFGAQGRGLRLIHGPDDLADADACAGTWYLQDLVPPGPEGPADYRVFVVRGRAVAAMLRRGTGWITNIHQGAAGIAVDPAPPLAALATAAAAAVGADFAGVDIIPAPEGRLSVLEVNSMPAWSGLQRATGLNIADSLAAGLTAALPDLAENRCA